MLEWYPKSQASYYLIIDVLTVLLFSFMVIVSEQIPSIVFKIVIIIIYLGAYYTALWYQDSMLLTAAVLGFVLTAYLAYLDESQWIFFQFAFADFVGRAVNRRILWIATCINFLLLTILVWRYQEVLFSHAQSILLAVMLFILLLPWLRYYIEKSKLLQREVKEAEIHISMQQERQRIARDLHDTLGHTLTVIKVKTELVSRLTPNEDHQIHKELDDILLTVRTAHKQVREIISEVNFLSLHSELAQCEKLLNNAGICVQIDHQLTNILLSSVQETMLAYSIREAVTNVVKHSHATECKIHLYQIEEHVEAAIIDNGIGLFDKKYGNGLFTIKERMMSLKGNAEVIHDQKGVKVLLTMPRHTIQEGVK
ncbi:sensor histidine kinase [Lysinibacillus sp. SGAir0095]|uniref:sensor histidine kinase n=1 Tax=Lysinibacillus sp. SGAir0095 TaxID=2070463 RepID=UPI0010CCDC08|nr:histidine kinase [Lysinibacillus sp. SGAir0095]QCR31128.1 sensor histidine kinase [Lysinibacillus sp. SGAir0095]